MTRLVRRAAMVIVFGAMLAGATPASAQIVQGLQFGVGAFIPRGFDTRVDGDVLVANLTDKDALEFKVADFSSGRVFAEWTIGMGDHVEFGLGAGLNGRTVPSVYRDLVNTNGREIEQTVRLRVVPLTALVRFLPFGRPGDVQPYLGAGVSALRFRYSESGSFVDATTRNVFTDRFTVNSTAIGGVVLGGIRLPLGGDVYGLGFEGRYQFGVGDTGGLSEGFLGDKIDLGGGEFNVTFLVRF